jgi:hypothetical protein
VLNSEGYVPTLQEMLEVFTTGNRFWFTSLSQAGQQYEMLALCWFMAWLTH